MTGVSREGGALCLELDPLPVPPSVPVHAVLDFRCGGRELFVAGLLSPGPGATGRLRVQRGPELRAARSSRLMPAEGPAFALFVSTALGGGRRCQPVLDLSARGMRIESRTPMDPGTVLSELTVVHRQSVVRVAEGVVASCSRFMHSDGILAYECGVRLRGRAHGIEPASFEDDEEITDLAKVRAVLWGLCDLEYEVQVFVGTEHLRGTLQAVGQQNRSELPYLCLRSEEAQRIPLRPGTARVECSLFGGGYRFYARVAGRRGDLVMLSAAPKLRQSHRRDEERVEIPGHLPVKLSFRHPFEHSRRIVRVLDLSAQGFAFSTAGHEDELWPGLLLKDARLVFPDLTVAVPEASVRSVSADRCGVQIESLSSRDEDRLRARLIAMGPARVELHDGEHLEDLVAFHNSMHLLEPDMATNLTATFEETKRTWRIAHRHRQGLMRTAVIEWQGGIGATQTSVRAYESTWLLQHQTVASASVPGGAGQLHRVLSALAAHRPDGEYVVGFMDASAKALSSTVRTFFSEFAPVHGGFMPFVLYSAPARPAPINDTVTMRRLRGRDEALVESVARRNMDPVCLQALSLKAGHIELPETAAAYRRAGLERRRDAFGAFNGERCAAVLLREFASPGLSLSGLLSAGMLLPALTDQDRDGACRRALCELLRATPLPGSPPYRFLFAPAGCDEAPLFAAGFRRIGECTLFAQHRLGLLDYQRFVSHKYGLLHARLRRRGTRIAEAA